MKRYNSYQNTLNEEMKTARLYSAQQTLKEMNIILYGSEKQTRVVLKVTL